MTEIKTDVLVIGAGSGGLSVAAGAAQMGADVTLLEGHKMGGDCLNYGCVPSKALLAAAKLATAPTAASAFGLSAGPISVDYGAVQEHVADVIAQIDPVDSQERFEGLGVRVIREFGHFTSPRVVQAGDNTIRARRVVIATGSSPLVPPIEGLRDLPYLTNETLFDLRAAPAHLLILGGGPIGMEMAQAHIRLGCQVTVLEAILFTSNVIVQLKTSIETSNQIATGRNEIPNYRSFGVFVVGSPSRNVSSFLDQSGYDGRLVWKLMVKGIHRIDRHLHGIRWSK